MFKTEQEFRLAYKHWAFNWHTVLSKIPQYNKNLIPSISQLIESAYFCHNFLFLITSPVHKLKSQLTRSIFILIQNKFMLFT